MHTTVLLNMFRYFFGYHIVMTKEVTEETRDFVAIGGNGFFHRLLVIKMMIGILIERQEHS